MGKISSFQLIRSLVIALCLIKLNLVQIISAEIGIGTFTKYAHGLESGPVVLQDTKTVLIRNFKYDGLGPDAWFQVAIRNVSNPGFSFPKERDDLSKNKRIPDENGSCDTVKAYTGKDITLTLPSNLTFANVEYIALYCYKYQHNFGYINIPQSLSGLNPYPSSKKIPEFCNGSSNSVASIVFLSMSLLFTFALSILH